MGLSLAGASPTMRTTVVLSCIACLAFAVYVVARSGTPTRRPSVNTDEMTSIRCTNCGYTTERNTAELLKARQIDPLEHVGLRGAARVCPKCGKETLEVVEHLPPPRTPGRR